MGLELVCLHGQVTPHTLTCSRGRSWRDSGIFVGKGEPCGMWNSRPLVGGFFPRTHLKTMGVQCWLHPWL